MAALLTNLPLKSEDGSCLADSNGNTLLFSQLSLANADAHGNVDRAGHAAGERSST